MAIKIAEIDANKIVRCEQCETELKYKDTHELYSTRQDRFILLCKECKEFLLK